MYCTYVCAVALTHYGYEKTICRHFLALCGSFESRFLYLLSLLESPKFYIFEYFPKPGIKGFIPIDALKEELRT